MQWLFVPIPLCSNLFINVIITMESTNRSDVSRKRDQSKIMKQWWQKKHTAVAEGVSLKAELEKLKDELANVTAGKELLHSSNKALSDLNRSIAAERDSLLEERDNY